jgi:flagellar hook assembly protein FlgD
LEDGIYAMRVIATDVSGNQAGTAPYEISFEVINESTVTNFYPYPNPFSTSTKFVFTLTGSEIPDQLKIQIMSVSGRVVREITQDEIGPIRIGNNITQFAWNGTDEYGDQLANGVYLYRVLLRMNGQSLEHRATSADKAFKNGFGKLYILR